MVSISDFVHNNHAAGSNPKYSDYVRDFLIERFSIHADIFIAISSGFPTAIHTNNANKFSVFPTADKMIYLSPT